jgi:hypothetical protein
MLPAVGVEEDGDTLDDPVVTVGPEQAPMRRATKAVVVTSAGRLMPTPPRTPRLD